MPTQPGEPDRFDTVGAEDEVGPPDRTVGLDSAVWLVVFALLIGATVGGLVVHSLQRHPKPVVTAGRVTVVREPPRTVVARVTAVVRKTQTKVSYVQTYVPPTTTTTPSIPGDLPDSTDPVVVALNRDRGANLSTTPAIVTKARRCAETDARQLTQHVCAGAAWSAAQSGRGLTGAGFVQGILAQADSGWLNGKYNQAASASAIGADGKTYWALVLTT